MRSLIYATMLVMLASGSATARQQFPGAASKSPLLAGDFEHTDAQPSLVLTNLSDTRTFQGSVSIGLGSSADVPLQFKITLAPQETRRLSVQLLASPGDQYTLMIHDQMGTLILYKIERIKPAAGTEKEIAPK